MNTVHEYSTGVKYIYTGHKYSTIYGFSTWLQYINNIHEYSI